MLKKNITYTDYNGKERTEEFRFNLMKTELVRMQNSRKGGLDKLIKDAIAAEDEQQLYAIFEDIVLKSYGVLDADGITFKKSKELSERFSQTPAFDELMFELLSDEKAAADFINAVVPAIKR